MIYEHGLKCWNGPERSARVVIECGIENQLVKVSEPEKCEYLIRMTSPVVCTAPQGMRVKEKDEL